MLHHLKSQKVKSALWVFGGYGGAQFIRLGSNLILTRLLAPEMFGLMALVNAILLGISLLSDVGIRDSIINTNKSAAGDRFLHTAWTLQIVRGGMIFLFVAISAPFFEDYFGYENLSGLLPLAAAAIVIHGFSSINMYVLEKELEFRPQICIELVSNFMGVVCMIIVAYYYQTVWSLVVSMIVQSTCFALLTNIVLPGRRMRFDWEWESVKSIIHLGKWIFLSTAAMYVTFQGDKLILAKMISAYDFGIYSIAAIFGYVLKDVVAKMSNKLLTPVYRQIVEEGLPLYSMLKTRFSLLLIVFCAALVLSLLGEWLINTLYDDRYANAGWILQWLVFAGICYSFDDTIRGFLVANRDSYHSFCVQFLKGTFFLGFALLLAPHYGMMGVLLAMALAPLATYPYLMYVVRQHGYQWMWIDFLSIFTVCIAFFVAWFFQDGLLWQNIDSLLSASVSYD